MYILVLNEKKLAYKDRKDFGLPKLNKYPMPDKEHVLLAIKFFDWCYKKHGIEAEKELAKNILKYAKRYSIKLSEIKINNRFSKYKECFAMRRYKIKNQEDVDSINNTDEVSINDDYELGYEVGRRMALKESSKEATEAKYYFSITYNNLALYKYIKSHLVDKDDRFYFNAVQNYSEDDYSPRAIVVASDGVKQKRKSYTYQWKFVLDYPDEIIVTSLHTESKPKVCHDIEEAINFIKSAVNNI